MSSGRPRQALERALDISRSLLEAAELRDIAAVTNLDGERRRLLESSGLGSQCIDAQDQSLLREIASLNDQALGLMQHHLRAKARDMDMASVGMRAVRAYCSTRLQR